MITGVVASLHMYPVKGCRGLSLPTADVERWGIAGDRRWLVVDDTGRFVTQREAPLLATVTAAPQASSHLSLRAAGLPHLEVAVPSPAGTPPTPPQPQTSSAPDGRIWVRVWRDEVAAALADDAAHRWFSTLLGRDVRLVYLDDPRRRAVDPEYGQPGDTVSFADGFPLLLTNAASLEDLNGQMAAPLPMNRFRPNLVVAGFEPWAEDQWRRIRVGEVIFRVVKPCGRCLVTTTDQRTGQRPVRSGAAEPLRTLAAYRNIDGRLVFGQNLIPDRSGTIRPGDPVEVPEIR